MVMLQWLWPRGAHENVEPTVVYYTLRFVMFLISFVLEDWAIHELVHSPRDRRQAVVLVASSYVTWTYQTHTFSNSIETLIVLWSLVLIERIVREEVDLPPIINRTTAHVPLEALLHHVELRPRVSACLWHFQSNHFPCFRCDTRHTFVATPLE